MSERFKTVAVWAVGLGLGSIFWTVSAAPPPKCQVCHNIQHNPHTLTISCNAVQAHLNHGDTLGPCPVASPEKPKKK